MATPTKSQLRAELRTRRLAFAAGCTRRIECPAWLRARLRPGVILASYRPVRGEADPAVIEQAALLLGARIALPHVTNHRAVPMRFLAWQPGDQLEAGPMGLQQPASDAPELAPDIILAPLLGFDDTLHRLGQGAAYYDRAFARYPDAWRVGIAWSVQEVPAVPVDPWDVPLHAVITETHAFQLEVE